MVVSTLCGATPPDEVAVDFATATMIDGVSPTPNPSPFNCPTCKDTGWIIHGDGHQTKCPNCDLAKLPGGFFDVVRQAKELIRKGNELADRGKSILDALQRDGKITVDIKIPKISKIDISIPIIDCPDGSCKVPQKYSTNSYERRVNEYQRTYTKPKSRWRWKR